MSVPIKPDRLSYGDAVGIVAPASAPLDPKTIDRGIEALERLGFKPRLAPNARKRWGFLAGSDRVRAGDLMRMFADRKVKAILCVRGGYGSARLLPLLDYRLVRRHPKIFVGYSDATALLCAFRTRSNLVCFHGPMVSSDLVKADCPAFTVKSFLETIMTPSAPGSLCQDRKTKTVTILNHGIARGELVGGNLSILSATIGTPYEPSFQRKILFFEDLEEPPYRFDRMLTQLLNGGRLQQLAGIAIGTNKNCNDPRVRNTKEYRQTLQDVFKDRLVPLGIPIASGLPFGHVPFNATLPVGVRAVLDAQKGDLLITEAAVK
jgi:muramoyltetrapeptide carboxypeptidase